MKISRKLTIMALSSIAAMVLIGGTGIYVENGLNSALVDVDHRGIPGMRNIYELKSHQQLLAIGILRHMLSNNPEQKAGYEKTIEEEKIAMDKNLTAYEAVARSEKGKELAKAERVAIAEYVGLLPPLLEKSRANDTPGALSVAATMTASRGKMSTLVDEHIAVNGRNTDVRAEESSVWRSADLLCQWRQFS